MKIENIPVVVAIVLSIMILLLFIEVDGNLKTIEEQEIKIEKLEERNATLQQERDEVYIQYWELSRGLERESVE